MYSPYPESPMGILVFHSITEHILLARKHPASFDAGLYDFMYFTYCSGLLDTLGI